MKFLSDTIPSVDVDRDKGSELAEWDVQNGTFRLSEAIFDFEKCVARCPYPMISRSTTIGSSNYINIVSLSDYSNKAQRLMRHGQDP